MTALFTFGNHILLERATVRCLEKRFHSARVKFEERGLVKKKNRRATTWAGWSANTLFASPHGSVSSANTAARTNRQQRISTKTRAEG